MWKTSYPSYPAYLAYPAYLGYLLCPLCYARRMKRTLFAFAAVLAFVATPALAQVKPNFSGTWNLDVAKSDFGPSTAPESMTMTIVHKDPSIKATSSQKS